MLLCDGGVLSFNNAVVLCGTWLGTASALLPLLRHEHHQPESNIQSERSRDFINSGRRRHVINGGGKLVCSDGSSSTSGVDLTDMKNTFERSSHAQSCEAWKHLHVVSSNFRGDPIAPETADPEVAGYWEKSVWPLSPASIRMAKELHGFKGARLRLQRTLRSIVLGESVTVAVIGGSMPAGRGVKFPWPARLQAFWEKLGYNVHVENLAIPGATSSHYVKDWSSVESRLREAQMILIDISINDHKNHPDFVSKGVQPTFLELLSLTTGLPQQPAVVDLESLSEIGLGGGYTCKDIYVENYTHVPVCKQAQVPIISYTEGVCNAAGNTYWFGSQLNHPGNVTHDLYARVILGSFALEMDEICHQQGIDTSDSPDLSAFVSKRTQCLSKPITKLTTSDKSKFIPVKHEPGWSYREDVPGKPGWIASDYGKAISIDFNVELVAGWIQIEFLTTYENIGEAAVTLVNEYVGRCHVSGITSDHASQSAFAFMRAEPGKHTLRITSDGRKFKLLSVMTC